MCVSGKTRREVLGGQLLLQGADHALEHHERRCASKWSSRTQQGTVRSADPSVQMQDDTRVEKDPVVLLCGRDRRPLRRRFFQQVLARELRNGCEPEEHGLRFYFPNEHA